MSTIHITPTPLGAYRITFPYDRTLVDLVKLCAYSHRRTWDASTKTWTLLFRSDVDLFVIRARALGHVVVFDGSASGGGQRQGGQQGSARPPRQDATPRWADALMDAVGPDRYDAVFKALTRVLHPDLGTGDTKLMQDLNAARDARRAA